MALEARHTDTSTFDYNYAYLKFQALTTEFTKTPKFLYEMAWEHIRICFVYLQRLLLCVSWLFMRRLKFLSPNGYMCNHNHCSWKDWQKSELVVENIVPTSLRYSEFRIVQAIYIKLRRTCCKINIPVTGGTYSTLISFRSLQYMKRD